MLKLKFLHPAFNFLVIPPIFCYFATFLDNIYCHYNCCCSVSMNITCNSAATKVTSVDEATGNGNYVIKGFLVVFGGVLIILWELWKWLLNYHVSNTKRIERWFSLYKIVSIICLSDIFYPTKWTRNWYVFIAFLLVQISCFFHCIVKQIQCC